jgi:hypothetical protein
LNLVGAVVMKKRQELAQDGEVHAGEVSDLS